MKLIKSIKWRVRKHLRSYKSALNGLKIAIRSELNFQIEILAAISIITASIYFQISKFEWIFVIFCIGLTLFAELINTSVETLGELRAFSQIVKKIKDLAAASVLVVAILDVVMAAVIFIPYFIDKFDLLNITI